MTFRVAEIRDRAGQLKAEVARERYETRAGLKERPAFRQLYEKHRLLLAPQVLPAIQRELARASGGDRRRLMSLYGWVASQQVEAELAPLEDELRAWEAGTVLRVGEKEIPIRRAPAAMARSDARALRLEIEAERNRTIEEAAALRLDVLHREREAVAQLGLGTYVEAHERLTGLNLRGLERYAVAILARTESPYRAAFLRHVGQRIGVEARSAARSDAVWLIGMRWLGQPFAVQPLLARVRSDLERLGLPLPREGVRIDLDRRPLKEADSFCAALEVPGDVIVVVPPMGGWADARGLLHEIGHALHFSHTDPELPFEHRALGDTSVTESVGLLFESLTLDMEWVESATGLGGSHLDDYLALAGFLQLYRARRDAARFLWEMELAASDRPGELAPRYAELLSEATGFEHHPVSFTEGIGRGFWVARRLRAWMLSAIMLEALQDRFKDGWYRDPAAGRFLAEILSAGQRDDASQLASQLGGGRLGPDSLLERMARWVG